MMRAPSSFQLSSLLFVALLFVVKTTLGQKIPFKIVALGDSYSAGSGNRDERGIADYVPPLGCNRSPTAWGAQYADSLRDVYEVTFIHKACSDNEVKHIFEPFLMEFFVYGDLTRILRCPTRNDTRTVIQAHRDPEVFFERVSPLRCDRFITPQIEVVDSSVDLLLITIGGIDAYFTEIVMFCLIPVVQDATLCRRWIEQSVALIENQLKDEILDLFRSLYVKMGGNYNHNKIVLVDYPYIVMDSDYELRNLNETLQPAKVLRAYQQDAKQTYQDIVDEINTEVGRDFVVFFNKTKDIFEGHEPDPSFRTNPDGWIHEEIIPRAYDSFHPNKIGYTKLAEGLMLEGTFGVVGGAALVDAKLVAHIEGSYAGVMGRDVVFKAYGSYDGRGFPIVAYEWDVDGDGKHDATTEEPVLLHAYAKPYSGFVGLKVINDQGEWAFARAFVLITEET